MTEKMTVSIVGVIHGDDEALTESETLQADTKEEVAALFAGMLESLAADIRRELAQSGEKA